MAIDHTELERHLTNYASVTGEYKSKFVCPITLKECDPSDLIHGHILNKKLERASRKTIIQYRDVDNFFGTTVEPSLVQYLNMQKRSPGSWLRHSREIRLVFADGSELTGFFGRKATAKKYPLAVLDNDGEQIELYVRTTMEDPRLSETGVSVNFSYTYMPAHHVAGMLKSGYLALFDLMGYRTVFDPCGNDVRCALSHYYRDFGTRSQAPDYFERFRNSVKVLVKPSTAGPKSIGRDTITNRRVLFHRTMAQTVFAISCVFEINDLTVTVTLPASFSNSDPKTVADYYDRLMNGFETVEQTVHEAEVTEDHIKFASTPLPVKFIDNQPRERIMRLLWKKEE